MDQICINKLEVFARHGVMEEEKSLGQKFLVTATLGLDLTRAGREDDLEATVNYDDLAHFIQKFMVGNRFDLVEACADQLARAILKAYPLVEDLSLEIHKPWAPVGLPLDDLSVRVHRARHTAFLGLGSNLGDKKAYLDGALASLEKADGICLEKVSSYIETPPYGVEDQPPFLNAVCQLKTILSPYELLDLCQALEKEAKRERTRRWGPRTLDLDLLFYDQAVIGDPDLNIPHPDLPNRAFVLAPLAEIAPYWVHPILGLTVSQLLDRLDEGKAS